MIPQQVLGSGSTFAYPVVAEWAASYERTHKVHIGFQPIGSSRGLAEVKAGLVDFAVSHIPLDNAQLARDGLAQFPVVIGAIVPVVNLDGIGAGQLHLSPKFALGIT